MENQMKKKFGLPTAICMVVGIVIGSGVFFKAESVLNKTGGNMPMGIIAWLVVGLIMIICSYIFATMATRYERVNGLVDYAEATCGKWFAYNMGWFSTTIYIPGMTSALAWISARYVCVLLGWDISGGACMTISCLFLCLDYALNALSPRLAGRFQVSATAIKMVPLLLMAVAGTIAGLSSGQLEQSFASASASAADLGGSSMMASCVAVAFAYEGWVLATSINAELRDAKRNLPRALVMGAFVVVATYILYYIGITGAVSPQELMASGEAGAKMAFQRVFGTAAGTIVFVMIVISCLGTLNGLMLACCRSLYSLAVRNEGPRPDLFRQVDPVTNMPSNSAVFSLMINAAWLLFFYGANLGGGWFGNFNFDSSELPIITIYGMYVPIFIQFMRKATDLGAFKRIIMPALGLLGCLFMVYAAFAGHGVSTVLHYLIIFVVIMAVGNYFYFKNQGKTA